MMQPWRVSTHSDKSCAFYMYFAFYDFGQSLNLQQVQETAWLLAL